MGGGGNPLYHATKLHINNSKTVTNAEKWDEKLNHLSVFWLSSVVFLSSA